MGQIPGRLEFSRILGGIGSGRDGGCYQWCVYLCTKYVAFIIMVYRMILTSEASSLELSKVNNEMQGLV
jgi:hypothetical protein